jgi:glycosyltransferase involved in cell wall biosynthesis
VRICFFADLQNPHVPRLAPALAARGHDVHIVCHTPRELPGVSIEKFRVPAPDVFNPRRWRGRWLHYLRGFVDRFDVVSIQFLKEWGFTTQLIEQGCVIASPFGSDIIAPPGEQPPSEEVIASRVSLIRHARGVTAWGPTFARMVAEFAGIDPEGIDLAPLGVDLDLFKPADSANKSREGSHRVGFFKGFREVYGPTYLIRAVPIVLQALPDTRFDFVGDGPQLAECQKLVQELGVGSAVRWSPRGPHGSVPGLLSQWDLTVIPSVCEAFGVAALEASAMRVPVVASDVGGLRDTVRDGETGLLVPCKSPEGLAEAIIALLRDPSRRQRMGEAGREWVCTHYEWQHTLDQWECAFQRALDRAAVMV